MVTLGEHGGAQSHVATLADTLAAHGDRVTVACGLGEDLPRRAAAGGHEFQRWPELVGPISPGTDLRAVARVQRRLTEMRPDIVHAHSSKAGLIVRLAAARAGVPCVFTAHGWGHRGMRGVKRQLILLGDRYAGRHGQPVIAVSEYDRRDGIRHGLVHPDQVVTIHNGLPDHEPVPEAPSGPLSWVTVARLAPPKRPDVLLRAWAHSETLGRLSVVGDGPMRGALEPLARGMGDRVQFWGARDDVPEVLAAHHAFLLASDFEGFPISILEAMRAGRAVVASAVGGVPEAVVHGVTGELMAEGASAEEWATTLAGLAGDAGRLAEMGRAGRERYLAEFTADRMAERVRAVYSRASGRICGPDTLGSLVG